MTEILDDICEAIVDCEHKTAPPGDGYALSVGTRAMKNGRLVVDACKPVSRKTYDDWTRRMRPRPGDLILAREAPVGQVVVVPEDRRLCLGQRTVLIRPDYSRVHPRFLHYWMLGPDAQGTMAGQAAGATVAHLNVEDIRALDVSRLPTNTYLQAFAAAVLGALDDLMANNRRRIQLLEQMAQAVYREWFVRFRFPGRDDDALVDSPLGPVPEGWKVTTCGEALSVLGGGTPSKREPAYWDGGTIPWFTPSDLTRGRTRYVAEPAMRITAEGLSNSSARLFPAGSVLMTSRATLGVLAIATTDASCNQGFIVIPPHDRWPPSFIYEWLDHHADELEVLGTGATFKEITKGAFKRFPFLLPPQDVVEAFREAVTPVEGDVRLLEKSSRNLGVIRDLLLPKLVTGQIDVSDLDLDALVDSVT